MLKGLWDVCYDRIVTCSPGMNRICLLSSYEYNQFRLAFVFNKNNRMLHNRKNVQYIILVLVIALAVVFWTNWSWFFAYWNIQTAKHYNSPT